MANFVRRCSMMPESLLARMPPVTVVPLLPPQPTIMTPVLGTTRSVTIFMLVVVGVATTLEPSILTAVVS